MCSGRGYHVLGDFSFKTKHTWLILRKRELKRGQKGTLLGQKRVSADAGNR
jgi:hypothetical protein